MLPNRSKVGVLIKTCQGRPSLMWTIASVMQGLKGADFRLYISDEEPLDDWKIKIYDFLNGQGHHIEMQKRGISCCIARNKLVESLNDEELVLRMDDDFELGGEFRFSALESILRSSKEIGFCSDFERQIGNGKNVRSGSIRPAGGDFLVSPPELIKNFHSPFKKHKQISGVRYSIAEHTRNLLLLKREVLNKVKWNEQLIFWGEHEDFMLSIREAGYKGAYTPDSLHYHRDDLAFYRHPDSEQASSGSKIESDFRIKEIFKERWNCTSIETKYPVSWYMVEAGRRLMDKMTS